MGGGGVDGAWRYDGTTTNTVLSFEYLTAGSSGGEVMAGQVSSNSEVQGYWNRTTGLTVPVLPDGWTRLYIEAVSADGLVVLGRGVTDTTPSPTFIESGAVKTILPTVTRPSELGQLVPADINGDGSLVVGSCVGTVSYAALWDEADGSRTVLQELEDRGLETLPAAAQLARADFVSDDGRIIVGTPPEGTLAYWRVQLLD